MAALTGRFDADFSNFTTAVDAATVKLRGFEADSNKVGTALTRMTESFSGTKVMQEAALMTEAVERLGGVSQMTEKDLQRIAPVVNEAIAKMNALGIEVPENMQKIAAATKNVTTEVSGMGKVMGEIQGMVMGAFTVQAVVNFGKAIFETADQIVKMSDQTGMTIEQVQRLQYVSGQTSVSMESMVSAMQSVTERLGSDDAGLNAALKKLNINIDDFKKQDAYTQFMTLAGAIGGVTDPTIKSADAAAVFLKQWKEVFPLLNDQMAKLAADATVAGDGTVKTIENAGDRIKGLGDRLTTWGATALASTMTGIESAASGWAELGGAMLNWRHGFETTTQELARFGRENDPGGFDLLAQNIRNVKPAVAPAIEGFKMLKLSIQDANDAAKEADKNAKQSIEDNTKQAAALKAVSDQLAADAANYWKGVDALKDKIMGVDAVTSAKQWSDAVFDLGDRIDKFSSKTLTDLYTAMQSGLTAMAMQGTLTSDVADRYTQLMIAAQQALEAMKQTKPVVEEASGATTEYTKKLYDAARAEDAQAASIAAKNAQLGVTAKAAGPNVGGSVDGTPYISPTGQQGGSIYEPYEPPAAANPGGAPGALYTPPKKATAPARAEGGPVGAGQSYYVGERGPELYTPTSDGMITPNGGGAVVVQNTFHIVDTESNIARRVSENILRSITQARRV